MEGDEISETPNLVERQERVDVESTMRSQIKEASLLTPRLVDVESGVETDQIRLERLEKEQQFNDNRNVTGQLAEVDQSPSDIPQPTNSTTEKISDTTSQWPSPDGDVAVPAHNVRARKVQACSKSLAAAKAPTTPRGRSTLSYNRRAMANRQTPGVPNSRRRSRPRPSVRTISMSDSLEPHRGVNACDLSPRRIQSVSPHAYSISSEPISSLAMLNWAAGRREIAHSSVSNDIDTRYVSPYPLTEQGQLLYSDGDYGISGSSPSPSNILKQSAQNEVTSSRKRRASYFVHDDTPSKRQLATTGHTTALWHDALSFTPTDTSSGDATSNHSPSTSPIPTLETPDSNGITYIMKEADYSLVSQPFEDIPHALETEVRKILDFLDAERPHWRTLKRGVTSVKPCVYNHIIDNTCVWAKGEHGKYACRSCSSQRRPCLRMRKETGGNISVTVLPLHPALREGQETRDMTFWVYRTDKRVFDFSPFKKLPKQPKYYLTDPSLQANKREY